MSVKLYDGCWGVTRGGEVVGPFRKPGFDLMTVVPVRPDFVAGNPGIKRFHNEAGASCHALQYPDIVRAFPSEASARAWLDRKPWWRRAWMWLKRQAWLAFGPPYDTEVKTLKMVFYAAPTVGLLIYLFTGCAAPNITTPHDARCVDGLHTHKTQDTK